MLKKLLDVKKEKQENKFPLNPFKRHLVEVDDE